MAIIAKVEYTDTFCGQANYCWRVVVEFDCEGMSETAVVRKAKYLLGISGLKANRNSFNAGDMLARYFNGTVMFIDLTCEDY